MPTQHTHRHRATTAPRHPRVRRGVAAVQRASARAWARLVTMVRNDGGYTSEAVIWTALAVIAAATVAGLILPALTGKAHEIVNQLR
jgi:hypothetical protein